jgi:hypothetical protein
MSAFLCSTLHTAVVSLVVMRGRSIPFSVSAVSDISKKLRKVNNRALFCRYGDTPEYMPRNMSATYAAALAWFDSANASDIFKLCQCFDYQCSEGDADKMKEYSIIREALQYAAQYSGFDRKSAVWSI